jgi:hypothetical protein
VLVILAERRQGGETEGGGGQAGGEKTVHESLRREVQDCSVGAAPP